MSEPRGTIGWDGVNERRRESRLNGFRRSIHDRHVSVSPRTFHLLVNAWGLVMGSLSFIAAVTFFLLPHFSLQQTSIGQQLGPLDDLWSLMYGIAGALIVYGLVFDRRGLDAAGLVLMAAATIINFAAIAATLGPRALIVAAQLLGVSAGAICRALIITQVVHVRIEARE